MASDFNNDNLFQNVSLNRIIGDRVSAVQPINKARPLPQGGNALPPQQQVFAAEEAELENAVKDLNAHIQNIQRELRFSVDETSGRTIIRVVNTETQEVIRQIPNNEVLKFARQLDQGADFDLLNTYS